MAFIHYFIIAFSYLPIILIFVMDRSIIFDLFPFTEANCGCCYPSLIFAILVVVLAISTGVDRTIKYFLGKKSLVSKSYTIISNCTRFCLFFIFIVLLFLSQSQTAKDWLFREFAIRALLKPQPIDSTRCALFSNLSGRILEIGPGPGTNFRCWGGSNGSKIVEWVGVEPNGNFVKDLIEQKEIYNITFPTSTVWLAGENINVEANSFDYVVGSHVLCSVYRTNLVLQQIRRALKLGGKYIFLEHVAAVEGSYIYYMQLLMQPFIYLIGNGCQFKRIQQEVQSLQGFDVHVEHQALPMAFLPLSPHISGFAVKLS